MLKTEIWRLWRPLFGLVLERFWICQEIQKTVVVPFHPLSQASYSRMVAAMACPSWGEGGRRPATCRCSLAFRLASWASSLSGLQKKPCDQFGSIPAHPAPHFVRLLSTCLKLDFFFYSTITLNSDGPCQSYRKKKSWCLNSFFTC